MVFIPRHRFNTRMVLTSGMGFDSHGEVTYSGSAVVSGIGYLKSTDEYAVTNAGIATVTRNELFTAPDQMLPRVGDRFEVTSGPAISSGTRYRVTNVRAIVDLDGFHALDIANLTELEV